MIVIKLRCGGRNRLYQYGGSGVFQIMGGSLVKGITNLVTKYGLKSVAKETVKSLAAAGAKAIVEKGVKAIAPTIVNKITGKKRKKMAISSDAGGGEPHSKRTSVDTGGVDINALIDGSGIVFD